MKEKQNYSHRCICCGKFTKIKKDNMVFLGYNSWPEPIYGVICGSCPSWKVSLNDKK